MMELVGVILFLLCYGAFLLESIMNRQRRPNPAR